MKVLFFCVSGNKGIATCSAMITFQRFNKQFGKSCEMLQNEDWFEINEAGMDYWKVRRRWDTPLRICGYCSDSMAEVFEWESSRTK